MTEEAKITVRKAVPADAETVAAFNMAMARQTEDRALDRATVFAGARRLLSDARLGVYYLAELSGRSVGQLLVTYEWSDWRNGLFWWIQSVYVAPDARRRGVYRALYRHVEKQARQTPDVCGLRLYVDRDNTAARRAYEQLGMRPTNYEFFEADWTEPDTDDGDG